MRLYTVYGVDILTSFSLSCLHSVFFSVTCTQLNNPSVSRSRFAFLAFLHHRSCTNVCSAFFITAPAHPQAISVAVYPALFSSTCCSHRDVPFVGLLFRPSIWFGTADTARPPPSHITAPAQPQTAPAHSYFCPFPPASYFLLTDGRVTGLFISKC